MHLRSISLHHFRLYEEAVFEFSPDVNVIYGPNAKGKTTVLEAIHVLMTGRSFRSNQLSDLIKQGCPFFYLEAVFIKHGIEQKLKFSFDGKERKVFLNSSLCAATSDLLGLVQGVVMTPDDAILVKGAPSYRRQFLDMQLAQVDPLYVHYLTRYNRAMRQRNCLLKAKNALAIEGFEEEMAKAASYITRSRAKTIADLSELGARLYENLSDSSSQLILKYQSGAPQGISQEDLCSFYRGLYSKYRRREMELGVTLHGPHKDDIAIMLGNQEARFFGSEGQQRSCVAALKLAEWERLKEKCSEKPLMLIDDIGLSLDAMRKERLLGAAADLDQVFLTSTEQLQISNTKPVNFIRLEKSFQMT